MNLRNYNMNIYVRTVLFLWMIQTQEAWCGRLESVSVSPPPPVNMTSAEDHLLRGKCKDLRERKIRCLNIKCFPCSHHNCAMGTCCPQELTEDTKDAGQYTGCMEGKLVGIVRCPDDWPQDDDLRQACENGRSRYTGDVPVSDMTNDVTFRNKDCAACHGVQTYVSWTQRVTCDHFQYVYMAVSEEELLEKASQNGPTCKIGHDPPDNLLTEKCVKSGINWYSPEPIRSCNVTGRWGRHDAEVADRCVRYTAVSLRVRHTRTGQLYQNVYCAECNGFPPAVDFCLPGSAFQPPPPPFTLLLGLQDSPGQHAPSIASRCPQGTWLDPEGQCNNVSCTAGKVLSTENSTCTTAVPMIQGLVYDLHITLIPKNSASLPDTDSAWERFTQLFHNMLQQKLNPSNIVDLKVYPSLIVDSKSRIMTLKEMIIQGWVVSSDTVRRDELEETWVDNLLSDWTVVDEVNNITLTFTFAQAGQSSQESSDSPAFTSSNFAFRIDWEFQKRFKMENFPFHLTIPLSPLLTCPAVTFTQSQFEVVPPQGIGAMLKVYLKFEGYSPILLPNISHVQLRNGSLQVCLSVLEQLSEYIGQGPVEQGSSFWEYVLSMTVIPLSMLCLLLILVVYSLLPALRTLPGLNLMGTCCTLLLAQLFLLLAVHRPVQGAWCTALGIAVHLFWLSTFCWTFVSSFHMFRTFSSSTRTSRREGSLRQLGKHVAATSVVPGVVVGVVVAVSLLTSNGQSIGYSAVTCYLSSPWLVGMAVVAPLGVIVVVNVVLFVLTVRRIQQVVSLKARAESDTESGQQHVKACFRLSLLTGATWALSIVAESLALPWLRAVSVLVNGGQGVVVLLSYLTTRRVLSMLADRCGCGHTLQGHTSSAVTSSTTGSSRPASTSSSRSTYAPSSTHTPSPDTPSKTDTNAGVE